MPDPDPHRLCDYRYLVKQAAMAVAIYVSLGRPGLARVARPFPDSRKPQPTHYARPATPVQSQRTRRATCAWCHHVASPRPFQSAFAPAIGPHKTAVEHAPPTAHIGPALHGTPSWSADTPARADHTPDARTRPPLATSARPTTGNVPNSTPTPFQARSRTGQAPAACAVPSANLSSPNSCARPAALDHASTMPPKPPP
jgi:hypothetical protein